MPLTPSRRSELRAEAHKLKPVVLIGDKGLTDEVLREIDVALKAHELIKVRANTDDRKARELWMEKIVERLQAEAVQQIGKVLVVYRENFDKPREKKGPEARGPRPEEKPRAAKRRARPKPVPRIPDRETVSTRTSRPRSRTPSPRPESGPRRRRPRTSR
jgi:RNA-binding protein